MFEADETYVLRNFSAVLSQSFARTEGQLNLPGGIRCRINQVGAVRWSALKPLQALTGDADLAWAESILAAVS